MADQQQEAPSAIAALLSGYAGQRASRHRLIWALDQRLARLAATTTEPIIGRIKLAWWSEALTDETGIKGRGEPLVDAMRAASLLPLMGLSDLLDGWEALMDGDLDGFATGRGAGLFSSLAEQDDVPPWFKEAGAVWALWDLSGHSANAGQAEEPIRKARVRVLDERPSWRKEWRPMRIAYELAKYDVVRGRSAPANLTPRLYLRLIRIAMTTR